MEPGALGPQFWEKLCRDVHQGLWPELPRLHKVTITADGEEGLCAWKQPACRCEPRSYQRVEP